jgi:hypothetical protein
MPVESKSKMVKPAHCGREGDYSCESPRVRFAQGGRIVQLKFAPSPAMQWNNEQFFDRSPRGKCKGFSFGSRRRMLNRLNEVSTSARLPYFVTATLPDDVFNDDVVRFAASAKVWMDNFTKRLVRVSPGACGFWRIEWKARLSGLHEGKLFPHFHLLVWGLEERELNPRYEHDGQGNDMVEIQVFESFVDLPDSQLTLDLVKELAGSTPAVNVSLDDYRCVITSAGTRYEFQGRQRYIERCEALVGFLAVEKILPSHPLAVRARKMAFGDWASLAWYHVVDSQNTDHLKAGLRVERVRSWGGVMSYCAKYMAKADCEFLSEISFGRSWGVFNRKCVPWAKIIEIDLSGEVGIRLRRVARHYLDRVCGRKRVRPYGLTLYCNVAQWSKLWERPPDTPF